MKKEDVGFARKLIKNINLGLDRLEKGSDVEQDYLNEKIGKLNSLNKTQE